MNNHTFGKYINNNSILTKIDARVKLIMMIVLLVFCFLDLNIISFSILFVLLCLFMFIGKLNFKSLFKIIKNMWLIFLIVLGLKLIFVSGIQALIETIFIVFRVVMILMISNLLSSTTKPSDLTYALEFYLKPLKIFKLNVYDISIMISIALRFIPTLIDEFERIKKAQTSRGIDFDNGKYSDKIKGITSLIIPLFISCFDKADGLTNAMIARGYDSGVIRTRYKRFKIKRVDILSIIVLLCCLSIVLIMNGVVL